MNTGSTLAQFTITLTKAVNEPVSVDWYTTEGSAKAGVDYAANKGSAVFAPGQTEKSIEILIFGRAIGAEDRDFFVEMVPPVNAVLGQSIGRCIIHVDTTGSQPVTQVIIPTGPQGLQGKSSYQSWLDAGHVGTEEDFVQWLRPTPEEIAEEIAPRVDLSNASITALNTDLLGKPDTEQVKAFMRRIAYASSSMIATVTLGAGDNTISNSDLVGDAVNFSASGFVPRILRQGTFSEPEWAITADKKLVIRSALAGDVLYAVEYDFVSKKQPLIRASNVFERYENSYFNKLKSFEEGSQRALISSRDALYWDSAPSGQGPFFIWSGSFPKLVPASSTPMNTGGIGEGAWLSVGAASIFGVSDLEGDAIIPVKQPFDGAVVRSVHNKMAEVPSVQDAGAKGNGQFNDTTAFTVFESSFIGRAVDLHGLDYVVDKIPAGNCYYNGKFIVGGISHDAPYVLARNVNNVLTLLGNSGLLLSPDYALPEVNQFSYTNNSFAAGRSLNKAVGAGQTIAIGPEALGNTVKSFDNIGIGEVALQEVQSQTDSYSTTLVAGTRNIGIGGNAGQKTVDGRNNTFVGRNSGSSAVSTVGVVAIGSNALSGLVTAGWQKSVDNFMPNNNPNTSIVAVGLSSGQDYQGINLTSIGAGAGRFAKLGQGNVLVGTNAGAGIESASGFNGTVRKDLNGATTYSPYVKTGHNVVVTYPASGATVGGYAGIYWSDGPAFANHGHQFPVQVIAVSGDTFTINCPYEGDGSGNARVYWTTTNALAPQASSMVLIGNGAGQFINDGNNNVVVGGNALSSSTTASSVVAIGKDAMRNVKESQTSVVVGSQAFRDNPGLTGCTALGHNAGLVMQDGSVPTGTLRTSTCIGYGASVSGDNQVQLGNSASTTYVYGTVQNRSDVNDKADVIETDLGIDFILGLRPVMGRWNMREDYIEEIRTPTGSLDDDGVEIINVEYFFNEKEYLAETKKRDRLHQWFIAQEVVELLKKLGKDPSDYGLWQHHAVKGGEDKYSLGYDEFIPAITKSIHQCWDRMDELEKRISSLESEGDK